MAKDEEIVSSLMKENVEFRKMSELHSEYEHRLELLSKRHYLSDNEKLEKSNLKKKKLAAKDKMHEIIQSFKSEGAT